MNHRYFPLLHCFKILRFFHCLICKQFHLKTLTVKIILCWQIDYLVNCFLTHSFELHSLVWSVSFFVVLASPHIMATFSALTAFFSVFSAIYQALWLDTSFTTKPFFVWEVAYYIAFFFFQSCLGRLLWFETTAAFALLLRNVCKLQCFLWNVPVLSTKHPWPSHARHV